MGLLEYPLSHPYPRERTFTIITIVAVLLLLPVLVLVNIVTSGYELVPSLSPDFQPNDTVPRWWNSPRLPPLLRRSAPPCEPKDFGRGDKIRLTPSLFEYKVLSAWRNISARIPSDESRVEYRGQSFSECQVYDTRFDYSLLDWAQTVTVALNCSAPINAFLETSITFANDLTKDVVGQYYGYDTYLFDFINQTSRDYRKAFFGVLDVISTDSLMIMGNGDFAPRALTLSARVNSSLEFESTTVTYLNGTVVTSSSESTDPTAIYRDSIYNLVLAVVNGVYLDLNGPGPYLALSSGDLVPNNIFRNQSAVATAFRPNLAPIPINPDAWIGNTRSFYYGKVVPPYQTWAEMLIAGQPSNITLGNLTGLPADSKMVTNYLCPSYQLKPRSSLLASIFIGTAAMYLSAWGAWAFGTAIVARKIRGPCVQCTCGALLDGEQGDAHNHHHGLVASGLAAGLVPPPATLHADSTSTDLNKEQDEAAVPELRKRTTSVEEKS